MSAGARSPSKATRVAVARFRDGVPRNLERIQESLRQGAFEFLPATGIPILREGKDPRPIVLQDVRDRVVQRSLLDVVMSVGAVAEAVDNGISFGGVPDRSVKDALKLVGERVDSGWAKYFIRSDIEGFFRFMPRGTALKGLTTLLPDRSLNELLDLATITELRNHEELGHLLDFFPNEVTGVPQGHALSALLGNLLLRPLDEAINSDGAFGVRYLDDFLILAPDKSSAWVAFREARKGLAALGLKCYAPGKSSKADEGSAQKTFAFLGCEVSRGFLRPSTSNRRKLLDRVEQHLERSENRITRGAFSGKDAYSESTSTTLLRVSRMLRGWAEQYSYCRYPQIIAEMDSQIDEMIRRYLGLYADRKDRIGESERRRMLGVWLLADATEDLEVS